MQLDQAPTTERTTSPIVISLGKESRKRIRRLKRGRGKLVKEVTAVMDQVRASFGEHAEGKVFVPVVLVYQRKRRPPPGARSMRRSMRQSLKAADRFNRRLLRAR